MFLDSSAIIAIMKREPEASGFIKAIEVSGSELCCSSIARFAATVSLAVSRSRQRGSKRAQPEDFRTAADWVDTLLAEVEADELDITAEIAGAALAAACKYGMTVGHPAKLNMGDCFAYACAQTRGVPLLDKGNDFAQTDFA